MPSFQVFVPIDKSLASAIESTEEADGTGELLKEPRTRYRLEGTASTTALDRDTEKVSKDCMEDMAQAIKKMRLPIFGNHEHDWENMIGYAEDAEVIDDEMHVSILTDYEETNPKVTALISKQEGGLPLGLSIGGKVKADREEFEESLGKNIRVIDKVELLEISVVGISANPEAYLSSLSVPAQISKSLKESKAREVEGAESPEPGDLPEKGKQILARVYAEARKNGYSKERASKIAWGAVNRAGYKVAGMEETDMKKAEQEFKSFLKSSGVLGEASYGKLGETTPEARCPECGRPGELREFMDGTAIYICNYDGTLFKVDTQGKVVTSSKPVAAQPAKAPIENIEAQEQEPMGRAKSGAKSLNTKKHVKEGTTQKGEIMKKRISKQEEPDEKPEGGEEKQVEEEKPEEKQEEEETEEEKQNNEDEEEYIKFCKFMKRFGKEMREKQEGATTPPGEENAETENTMEGTTAKPAPENKSASYELTKKAFKENVGIEGLEQAKATEFSNDLSVKGFKREMLKRK